MNGRGWASRRPWMIAVLVVTMFISLFLPYAGVAADPAGDGGPAGSSAIRGPADGTDGYAGTGEEAGGHSAATEAAGGQAAIEGEDRLASSYGEADGISATGGKLQGPASAGAQPDGNLPPDAPADGTAGPPGGREDSWIAKWAGEPPAEFLGESVIVEDKKTLGVLVVRPRDGLSPEEWAFRWQSHPDLIYLQPNQKVHILFTPNDEYFAAQEYLRQIQAPAAWDLVRHAHDVTVAVIDTGVDLDHPDLADHLVEGVNLVKPGTPPQDDHGHGTNVAGVIAAVGNNGIGTAGLAWTVKLMPIKALESDGMGDEDKLGEAIRYAVDKGADIVVMSLGLNRYSPFLREIVDYAEQKGVLLVSAVGNEGRDVKYPAAYPTVLAVGGASVNNRVRMESNHGPEIDLVAPWEVFTTAIGSDYAYNQGTSMAAPQVAGAAALVLSAYPQLKPYEVRNLLRQTALDIEDKGWDSRSGYGLLQVNRALSGVYLTDMYEPNDTRSAAATLPLDTEIYGELSGGSDQDWFEIKPDYKGTVRVEIAAAEASETRRPNVKLLLHRGGNQKDEVFENVLINAPTFTVNKGQPVKIRLQYANTREEAPFLYKLRTVFSIYADSFEDNDRQYKAYNMSGNEMKLTGTFHKLNDQDWFSIIITESATLNLTVEPDTMRMDLSLLVQKNGEKAVIVDKQGDGGSESLTGYELTPGRYYILVHNVISDNAYPVRGEYRLTMKLSPKKIDPNEPNNRMYQATRTVADTEYVGQFDKSTDQDWFMLNVPEESLVEFHLGNIPKDRMILMALYDSYQTQKQLSVNALGEERLTMSAVLGRGTYYVKLSASQPFSHQLYSFRYTVSPLVAGFKDIKGHWAEKEIVELVKRKAVSGYGDYSFRPNLSMTRAEAVTVLVKAFNVGSGSSVSVSFKDVRRTHWAYESIQRAVKAGIVTGFEDGSFRPDQKVSRAEMAAMLGRAMGLKEALVIRTSFRDMRSDHWAAGWIERLVREGILSGYADQTFRPEQIATRAEVAVMIVKALNK